MRIAFIGCVEFSYSALDHLLTLPEAEVVGIVTRQSSAFNADFRSLEPLAARAGIRCLQMEGNEQEPLSLWLGELEPEVIYCFGWSYLLKSDVLTAAPLGVIGYHPAALPRNRGRHPIIWALTLGLRETASTFFFMDEGADSGDILSQRPVPIHYNDDAGTLYHRLERVARDQIADFTSDLSNRRYERRPQDHTQANYWRKRDRQDGRIDWRMGSRSIHNLVRALTHPYPGADLVMEEKEWKVWAVRVVDDEYKDVDHLEPGKILGVEGQELDVKCGTGVLRLTEHEIPRIPERGEYL